MPRALSDDLRKRSVFLHGLNYPKNVIAGRLGISSNSVSRFSRRFYERGNVSADKPGRPTGSSLSLQEQAVIIQELLEHPERTLSELCTHVEAACGARIPVSTPHDYFRRNGITRKMEKRISRRYGYSFRGYRAEAKRYYGNWGPRITAIPIIYTEGLLDVGVFRGSTDEAKLLQFANENLLPNLLHFNGTNPRSVVIMDNVTMHRCRRVVEAINTTGALVVYLPSYSPDFSPCENVFSQAKSWIKANDVAWQVCDSPEEMVFEAFMQISVTDVREFLHFTNYL